MKMSIAAILACGIALGAVLTVAADSGTGPDKSELDTLRQRVQALEARVEMLEKRLAERQPDFGVPTPPARTRSRRVPDDWLPREFNGRRYYVVPLQQDSDRPLLPKK